MIGAIRPRFAILTHFGMTMVRGKPWELAERAAKPCCFRPTGVRLAPATPAR